MFNFVVFFRKNIKKPEVQGENTKRIVSSNKVVPGPYLHCFLKKKIEACIINIITAANRSPRWFSW